MSQPSFLQKLDAKLNSGFTDVGGCLMQVGWLFVALVAAWQAIRLWSFPVTSPEYPGRAAGAIAFMFAAYLIVSAINAFNEPKR